MIIVDFNVSTGFKFSDLQDTKAELFTEHINNEILQTIKKVN